jgi:hypothetical protein
MVTFMLTRGEAFVDQGQQRHEELQRRRCIAALKCRAAAPPRWACRSIPSRRPHEISRLQFCFLRQPPETPSVRWALTGFA